MKSKEFTSGQKHQKQLDEFAYQQKIKKIKEDYLTELKNMRNDSRQMKQYFENEKNDLRTQNKKELAAKDKDIAAIRRQYNDKRDQLDQEAAKYKEDLDTNYKSQLARLETRRKDLERTIEAWENEMRFLEEAAADLYRVEQLVEAHSAPLIKASVRLAGQDKDAINKVRELFQSNRSRVLKSGPKKIKARSKIQIYDSNS